MSSLRRCATIRAAAQIDRGSPVSFRGRESNE
jgi:hypothetical protein